MEKQEEFGARAVANIAEQVFTDEEIQALITQGRLVADYSYSRNKVEHYERYLRLATALAQVVRERDEARAALTEVA